MQINALLSALLDTSYFGKCNCSFLISFKMPKICFAPGCKTGYTTERRKWNGYSRKPSLFKPPKDPVIFDLWKRSIPRADREFSPKDFVCDRHFKEEDILRYYETLMPDGSIHRLERGSRKLKPGSIPCYFPEVPGHSSFISNEFQKASKKTKKPKETRINKAISPSKKQISRGKRKISLSGKDEQKRISSIQLGKENILFEGIVFHPVPQNSSEQPVSLKEREDTGIEINSATPPLNCSDSDSESLIFADSPPAVDCLDKESSTPNICEAILSESNVILPKSVIEEQFSFNFLKININMVDTMNSWWKVNVLDDFISFIRWMPNYTVERKIVITKDLSVKVFLMDKETTIGRNLESLSIDVISKLIFRVERTQICCGINKKERNCDGFLQGVYQCKRHNLCLSCIKWEREQRKLLLKRVKLNDLVELIRFNLNQ